MCIRDRCAEPRPRDPVARDAPKAAPSAGRARTRAARALRSAIRARASARIARLEARARAGADPPLARHAATPHPRRPAAPPRRRTAVPQIHRASAIPTAAVSLLALIPVGKLEVGSWELWAGFHVALGPSARTRRTHPATRAAKRQAFLPPSRGR